MKAAKHVLRCYACTAVFVAVIATMLVVLLAL